MTNDGNAILREITVQHPAAKHMIEIARTQDEEVLDFKITTVLHWLPVEHTMINFYCIFFNGLT